ncbi:MAG: FAD-dependent oxidoreductase [Ignavibacteria bacterium]|nr:FAD-dependent oxidoreductase [Ignavibacteria bacterium]
MLTIDQVRSEKIPAVREVDILVVGGGTAGAVAGIAAARQGLKTLVVEQLGFLGGTQTGALVTPMMPNQIDEIPLNSGIDREINDRLIAKMESGVWKDGNRGWFNPEMLKLELERMNVEAGAELLYYSFFEDVIMKGSSVQGIIVTNKAGRQVLLAKQTIDCTGDADVALQAGVPCESGDPNTKLNQPFSVRFHLGNVDLKRFGEFLRSLGRHDVMESAEGTDVTLLHTAMVWGKGWTLEPLFRKAVEEGILNESDGNYFQAFSMAGRPGEVAFNCPRISTGIDGTDPFHLTKAQIKGRAITQRYVDFCRKYLPGFEDAYLVFTAPMVGVRESRRIRGEYYLTVDDVLGAKKFPDAICRNNYPLDIHRDKDDDALKIVKLPKGEYHEVPYRCLVPLKAENLLVAGRCLSASFEAQSSVRIQTNCRAMGEAAAVAAAMAIRKGITPRDVDGIELRRELVKRGASL